MRGAVAGMSLGAVIFVAGCSGSSASDATPTASPNSDAGSATQASLQRAVRAYSAAYLAGRGDAAYSMLSARCQERVARADLRGAAAAAESRYGADSIRTLTVDSLLGTSASVTYTYTHPAINQTAQRWVFEDGAWRYDQC